MTVVVGAMQAGNMGRLVASLPAGVEEGTLFPQRRPAAGGRCSGAAAPQSCAKGRGREGRGAGGSLGTTKGRRRSGRCTGDRGLQGDPDQPGQRVCPGCWCIGPAARAEDCRPPCCSLGLQPSLQLRAEAGAAVSAVGLQPWQQTRSQQTRSQARPTRACPISWLRPTCGDCWRPTATWPRSPSVGPRPPPWRPLAPPSPPAHHTPSLTHVCSESLPTTHGCWGRRGCPQGCPLPC